MVPRSKHFGRNSSKSQTDRFFLRSHISSIPYPPGLDAVGMGRSSAHGVKGASVLAVPDPDLDSTCTTGASVAAVEIASRACAIGFPDRLAAATRSPTVANGSRQAPWHRVNAGGHGVLRWLLRRRSARPGRPSGWSWTRRTRAMRPVEWSPRGVGESRARRRGRWWLYLRRWAVWRLA
jgi:hypothetical protein